MQKKQISEDQPESLQTRQMMDESDDDFQELCASFFQRVKKNGPKEVSKEKKTQKASNGTQIRSKPKRTKPTASKSKTPQGAAERKTCPGGQVPRTQKHRAPKRPETAPAPPENTEGGVPTSAVLQDSAWSTQTGNLTCQVPLSVGFPRQNHRSGLPFRSPVWKTQSGHRLEKVSFHSNPKERQCRRNVQTTTQLHSSHMLESNAQNSQIGRAHV